MAMGSSAAGEARARRDRYALAPSQRLKWQVSAPVSVPAASAADAAAAASWSTEYREYYLWRPSITAVKTDGRTPLK